MEMARRIIERKNIMQWTQRSSEGSSEEGLGHLDRCENMIYGSALKVMMEGTVSFKEMKPQLKEEEYRAPSTKHNGG